MPAPASNTDLTSTSGLSSLVAQQQKDIGRLSKDIAASTAEEKATEDSAYKGFTSDLSSIADQFEKLKKEGEDVLKPFTPPKPEDPLKSYGATIGGLMGIVSFFTHQPMIGSLNAAAAAINAARAGNSDAYDKAFEQWKANTELASKRLDWENSQLNSILNLSKTNYDAAVSHTKALASITNDKALVVSLEANGIEGVSKLLDARIRGQEAADKHQEFLWEMGEGFLGAPKGTTLAQWQKDKQMAVVTAQGIEQGEDLIKQLDSAGSVPLTGITGRYERAKESIEGQVAPLVGSKAPSQPAKSFENSLNSFRNSTRILVAQSKYMSRGAQEFIEDLVKGDNNWDTTQDAKETVQKIIDVMRSEAESLPPGVLKGTSLGSGGYVEGQTYVDAKGNKAKYKNGQFVPVP